MIKRNFGMRTSSRSAPEICVHVGDRLLPFTPPRPARRSFGRFLGSTAIRRLSLALLLPVPWVGCFFLMALLTRSILIRVLRRVSAQQARAGALSARHKAHSIGRAQKSGALLS